MPWILVHGDRAARRAFLVPQVHDTRASDRADEDIHLLLPEPPVGEHDPVVPEREPPALRAAVCAPADDLVLTHGRVDKKYHTASNGRPATASIRTWQRSSLLARRLKNSLHTLSGLTSCASHAHCHGVGQF